MAKSKSTKFDVSLYMVKADMVSTVKAELFSSSDVIPLKSELRGGLFLPLPAEETPPKWTAHVESLLADGERIDILSLSPGGLLWIPHAKSTFLFTFGYAHAKLKDDWLEPDFGRKVALSVIPPGQVVEVRSEQVFAKWHLSSERAPKAAAVREFNFEADRDLIAAVEGIPALKYIEKFGGKVRGSTAIRYEMDFSKVCETLDVILERFSSGDCKRNWPQVDNLEVVRDPATSIRLDNLLDKLFETSKGSAVSLAAPAARNGDRPYPHHFIIGRAGKNAATQPYLLMGGWQAHLKGVGGVLGVSSARSTVVHLLDEEKKPIERCTMYQCIGAEISLMGSPYIISSGVWYKAKRQFIVETNDLLRKISEPKILLSVWNGVDDEGSYNEGAKVANSELWLFDKKNIWFGGGRSQFEFCDLMHLKSKTLYFVKQPSASASMSHLCEQVRRTAENFFSTDEGFRKKLQLKIVKDDGSADVAWLAVRPARHEWSLCLVSMGKSLAELSFFSKCAVARLVRELETAGFNVRFQVV